MTTVPTLLAELARTGIKLRLVGDDRIEVAAPKGRLSADLRERIARHKPELLSWLVRTRDERPADDALPTVVPDPDGLFEPFPPSDLQTSFLIGSREGFEHHVRPHQYMELDLDELDPVRFNEAVNWVLRRQRHNLMVARPDLLLQAVRDPAPVDVPVTDLRHLSDEEAQRGIERVRATMERREPPIDRWPWLDIHVCLYGAGRARLHYNNNNLFNDAPALVGFLRAALQAYRDPDAPLPELEISYRDCVLALAALEEGPLGQASKKYWTDRMAGWPDPPAVPLAADANPRQRSLLHRREMLFPATQWAAIKAAAGARGITLTNALLGAHAELLAQWSGSRHFLLNNMITHRMPLHPQIGEVMGNFASLYPLEVDWRHDETFTDRVHRLQAQVVSDIEHGYWSGVKVLQALNQVRRTPGRAVCPFAVGSALFVGQFERPVYSVLETPQVIFDCEFWELPDGDLWVVWDVIESMFPDGLIDAMEEGYRAALTELASGEAAWAATALDLLPTGQRTQRALLNRADTPVPGGLLHDPLTRWASARPDQPAVVAANGTLTYAALNRHATRLAALLRERATPSGSLVAIVLPKGWEQIAAVLGTLVAGCAYVPVDPGWPPERIRFLIADTGAAAILTTRELTGHLADLADIPVLAVDRVEDDGSPESAPTAHRRPDDLAYVIYTSGSTGRPKGAMLDHRGPLNTITDINGRHGIGPDDVVFGVSSLCFDLSVYDLFGTLAAGAKLVLPDPGQSDPASWLDLVGAHGVTVWNSVPAIMQLFVEAAAAAGARFPALRIVLLSGDWIPVTLPDRIRRIAPNARVISLGGATEASIWSISFPIDRVDPAWTSIPYGRPLANQTWHVLDELGRDAPTWVPGQLHIGGVGVALGYLGDPEKTEAAFVRHPRTGERLYRTGDLGRYLPSGDIEFLGRADFQVKIQGFRVEPGEVEQVLLEHPGIRQAAVVARSSGSGKQLAAFVVGDPAGDARPDGTALREFLAGRLPSYLVPSQVTVLDRLPLTDNGKLDRPALEALGGTDRERGHGYVAPRTPTETALVEIWESILDARPIGVHDDFFDLGGQSFAALRMTGQISRRLGRHASLGELLELRTVARLADWLDRAERSWSPLVRLRDSGDDSPWFLVHPAGGNVLCYQGLAAQLDQPVYAFQAAGPATGGEPLDKVEDFAAHYLRALREVQPHGPYLLGGWSSGAILAWEMAHQLESDGETVEHVVVIDAPAPVSTRAVDDVQSLRWFLEDLDIGFTPGRVGENELRRIAAALDADDPAAALALAGELGLTEAQPDPAGLSDAFAVFRGVVRACNSYRAPEIASAVTVVRAGLGTVSEFAGHPFASSPDWGWASLSTGAVACVTVPGTHHTLLTQHTTAVACVINGRPRRIRPGG
ncbi:amino acid adenylation domain-containing protein [Micromonospora sp. SL1-18]|uniref:non-ribosomal peptide synthetase n=1 Tax=Micromonospora sp. SL1-18 TaxID=3399128 RepID=UPI003A4D3898